MSILNQPPQSSWQYGNKILSISVNGVVPLSNPVFVLEKFFIELTETQHDDELDGVDKELLMQ